MAISDKILPHYTYDVIQLWNDRFELYDGFPVAMSPSPAPRHQQVAAALRGELYLALKKCKNCKVYDPLDFKIEDDIVLIPDILISCKKITKNYLDFPPNLVVEILSPSTALRDKNTKFSIYQSQGVKYYLIVDADSNQVDIYQLINGEYVLCPLINNRFEFEFKDECKANIDFGEIW